MKTKQKNQTVEKPNFWTEKEEQSGIDRALIKFSGKVIHTENIKNK